MPYYNNAFFLECANSLPAGASSQTSQGILQRFHRYIKLNMTGIEIFMVHSGGSRGHIPLKRLTLFPHVVYQSLIDEWNWLKKLESVLQQWKRFGLWGDFVPRPLIKFQSFAKLPFSQFQFENMDYVNVGESMLLNEVVYLRCSLKIYAPTFSIMTYISQKKLQRLGTAS